MPETPRLMVVRHGHHDWLTPPVNRFAGRLPGVHLSASGRAAIEVLAGYLEASPPDRIASSPLERAMETAGIIAGRLGLAVHADDRLTEAGLGPWEGMLVAEVMAHYPLDWKIWRSTPSQMALKAFEPVEALANRMADCARDWMRGGGTALLVSHQDPILALVCRLLDLPIDAMRRMDIAPGSLTAFEFVQAGPVLVMLNAPPPACPLRPGKR